MCILYFVFGHEATLLILALGTSIFTHNLGSHRSHNSTDIIIIQVSNISSVVSQLANATTGILCERCSILKDDTPKSEQWNHPGLGGLATVL